jgi:hypothetical protein
MRWVLERTARAGERAGLLELAGGAPSPTPFPLLSTRGGLPPHLTKETLALLPWARGVPALAPLQYHIDQVRVPLLFH